jgi:hypothetical protein
LSSQPLPSPRVLLWALRRRWSMQAAMRLTCGSVTAALPSVRMLLPCAPRAVLDARERCTRPVLVCQRVQRRQQQQQQEWSRAGRRRTRVSRPTPYRSGASSTCTTTTAQVVVVAVHPPRGVQSALATQRSKVVVWVRSSSSLPVARVVTPRSQAPCATVTSSRRAHLLEQPPLFPAQRRTCCAGAPSTRRMETRRRLAVTSRSSRRADTRSCFKRSINACSTTGVEGDQ